MEDKEKIVGEIFSLRSTETRILDKQLPTNNPTQSNDVNNNEGNGDTNQNE